MTAYGYMCYKENESRFGELLPISTVPVHPRAEDKPGVLLDVIINKTMRYDTNYWNSIDVYRSFFQQNGEGIH